MNVEMDSCAGEIVIYKNNFDIIEGGVDKIFDPKKVMSKRVTAESSLNVQVRQIEHSRNNMKLQNSSFSTENGGTYVLPVLGNETGSADKVQKKTGSFTQKFTVIPTIGRHFPAKKTKRFIRPINIID